MSGICGIWALSGADPASGELEPMLAALRHRGPDRSATWSDGPVALGHALLATTPEAVTEPVPLVDPVSGCVITADVRLDNREELIAELEIRDPAIGDAELILRAYLEWGEEAPTHLLGDFAFAIWDPRATTMFCARDHMGLRQLIYHHAPDRLFAFATDATALVAQPGVPKRINEARIADFLDGLEAIDFTTTFFEEVFRLPPAHTLTINATGLSLRRYWLLTPGPELRLGSDQAYADAFLAVFTEAVRCRLRSAGPVGSMLSGGIDSNSVATVASRLLAADGEGPLLTFSAIGPEPIDCVESRAIRSALTGPGLSPTLINHAELDDSRDELIRLAQECAEPFDGYMSLVRSVYLVAHRRSVKVMLDGAGGDVVLTAGNRIAQLLARGRIRAALSEARSEKRFWGRAMSIPRDLLAAVWTAVVPANLRDLRRRLSQTYKVRSGAFKPTIIAPEFADRVDLTGRRALYRSHLGQAVPDDRESRAQAVRHPRLTVARERYDRIASALQIEPRDPFLDIRVIQLCLSMPSSQLQADGWPKTVLRRAMEGLIPSDVIWRRGKEHLGWTFTQALFNGFEGQQSGLRPDLSRLSHFVSRTTLAGLASVRISPMDRERQFELFILSCWLARHQAVDESLTRDGD